VANGTYYEQVVMIPGLALIGSGMDSCVIDTRELAVPQDFVAVRVKENGILKGFHIIVSASINKWGFGIYIRHTNGLKMFAIVGENRISNAADGIVIDDLNEGICKQNFIYNVDKGISIINFYDSQPIIENNFISDINLAGDGISIALGGKPIIRNNTIVDDDLVYGIFGSGDSLFIRNNQLLVNNTFGAIILPLSPTLCENNLIIGENNNWGILARTNDIILNNSVNGGIKGIHRLNSNETPIIKYNDSWNNETNYSNFLPDSTNISVDPMFVTENNRDFHLQMFSPLIDAGDPNILDKDGSRSDIGLYGGPHGEMYLYEDLPPKAPRSILASLDTGIINLTWKMNTEADLKYYNIYRDTVNNFIIDSTKLITSTGNTNYLEPLVGSSNLYYKVTAVDKQKNESIPGEEVTIIVVGVDEPTVILEDYILYQNYPNPFNPSTIISYRITTDGYVKLNIYDIKGEKITELVNEYQKPGYYEIKFSDNKKGEDLASGIYLYKLDITEKGIPVYTSIKKMIRLK
jgi:hypothetical protein